MKTDSFFKETAMTVRVALVILSIASSPFAIAQDLQSNSISWTVTGTNNLSAGSVSGFDGTIITQGISTLIIKDSQGITLKSFSLNNPIGLPFDLNQNGRIQFTGRSSSSEIATIILERSAHSISIYVSTHHAIGTRSEIIYQISETRKID